VLGLSRDITVFPAGSSDTTFNYVQLLCFLVLAVVVTTGWTLWDRRRSEYHRLHQGLRAYVRLALGSTLITYGAFKVVKSQFAFPFLHELLQPLGESSPMGLLWKFMGYSLPYNVFVGAGEMAGGVLLFSRRTTTLGALVSAATLSHVVALNLSYDVPVKIFSLHLLGLAALLLWPDARRLADFFLANRPTAPAPLPTLFVRRAWNQSALVLRWALFGSVLGFALFQSWNQARAYGDLSPHAPLRGLYEVEQLLQNGALRPPLLTDTSRWRHLAIDRPWFLAAVLMDGSVRYYDWSLDPVHRTMALKSRGPEPQESVLRYTETAAGGLVLEGELEGDRVRVTLQRMDPSRQVLLTRGFHWVSEYPFNR
jgi:hypothetical protein